MGVPAEQIADMNTFSYAKNYVTKSLIPSAKVVHRRVVKATPAEEAHRLAQIRNQKGRVRPRAEAKERENRATPWYASTT